jgi:hypothetical protein
VHLIILFFLNFKDKLEVLLCEAICTELRPILFPLLVGNHHDLLHLPAQGDFLHHGVVVAIIRVLRVELWGAQKTSGQRNALARWWHFLLSKDLSMEGVWGGRRLRRRPLAVVPWAKETVRGGKFVMHGEGSIVLHNSLRLPHFSQHDGKNAKAGAEGREAVRKCLG